MTVLQLLKKLIELEKEDSKNYLMYINWLTIRDYSPYQNHVLNKYLSLIMSNR
jgi:hypothetical protein